MAHYPRLAALFLALLAQLHAAAHAEDAAAAPFLSTADIVKAAPASDWRTPDPENLLYMDLPAGRVVIELAPRFAPRHVDNLRKLVRQGYFDGLAILRAQDNYVVQWGDPDEAHPRSVGAAAARLPAEFERPASGLDFDALPEPDVYAPEVGFVDGFPAARDRTQDRAWPLHCYGMVGAGRDVDADSGGGTELYAVIGHAPRQLDRNVSLVGRVLQGMELLSVMPRGGGDMGFYTLAAQRTTIRAVRVAADVEAAGRVHLEVMRTDSPSFRSVVEARRNRRDPWTKRPAGRIEICNVPLPVRVAP